MKSNCFYERKYRKYISINRAKVFLSSYFLCVIMGKKVISNVTLDGVKIICKLKKYFKKLIKLYVNATLFFYREFQHVAFAPDDSFFINYHQTKTPISFWCWQGLNLRFLIQPLETLSVELIKTHYVNSTLSP